MVVAIAFRFFKTKVITETKREACNKFVGHLRKREDFAIELLSLGVTKEKILKELEKRNSRWVNLVKSKGSWKILKPQLVGIRKNLIKKGKILTLKKYFVVKIEVKIKGKNKILRVNSKRFKDNKVKIKITRKDGVKQYYWYKYRKL